jgi:threonine dehydratase
MTEPTIEEIQAARERIRGLVRHTPITSCEAVSRRIGCDVRLKLELFQKTGSFKVRGALNKVLATGVVNCRRGLVAVSGGNHAQAVAYAARHFGLACIIVMPENTPANYVDGTRGYGAEVLLVANIATAFEALAIYEKDDWLPIHPFDDPLVIAGQGTVGLEILEDAPDVTDLVVSIGGGGFVGGIATAVKALQPGVRIWGVETEGADAMTQAIREGQPVQLAEITSIAKTLGAPAVSARTLGLAQKYLESVTLVSDRETVQAIGFLLERAKVLTEPAAACTLAAALRLQDSFGPGSKVVLVLCGGNVRLSDVCSWRQSV